MFGLFKKSKSQPGPFDFARIGADMHSHILPGIDDGAKDLAQSVELVRGMVELGYKKLIATPHIMWDMYRNTPEIIQQQLERLRKAVKEAGIQVELHAAAEYFLDEHVEELLSDKQPLLTVSDNKVLAEFSMAFPALNIKELLFEMQMQGYQPIIAHPERYVYLQRDKTFYDELKDSGCLFQLNLLSIDGYYGRTVQELAGYLLKQGYYDLLGTDLHHEGHLNRLRKLEANPQINELMESGRILNAGL